MNSARYSLGILWLFLPIHASATYSIVACDAQTRACGVAVQTNNLAVGASVPYAQAGVGAVASQFETNPAYGPRALALMAQGRKPQSALDQILREDGNFEGQGTEARQVGVVGVDGDAAVFTGSQAEASPWAGARKGKGYSIQGNGLAGARVVENMERVFLNSAGPLAERLLLALEAGDAAGGQTTGRESAALLVRTLAGYPIDVDLRVDHSSDPVRDLRTAYSIQAARQQVIQAKAAAQQNDAGKARALLIGAVARTNAPRVCIQAARVAVSIGDTELAVQYLSMAFSQNAAWAREEIGSGRYAELGANPLFHRWVTPDQEKSANTEYRGLQDGQASEAKRIQVARVMLEVGDAADALRVLPEKGSSAEIRALRSQATAALSAK
jgi:uncharacterized Ntn-hydrolase superfamily protein